MELWVLGVTDGPQADPGVVIYTVDDRNPA